MIVNDGDAKRNIRKALLDKDLSQVGLGRIILPDKKVAVFVLMETKGKIA